MIEIYCRSHIFYKVHLLVAPNDVVGPNIVTVILDIYGAITPYMWFKNQYYD